MSLDLYYDDVVAAIGLVLETDDLSELSPHTHLERDLGFTSGVFIELLMYLEERVDDLSINPVTLDTEQIATIEALCRFIHTQRENNASCA
ncbi:acyl carrier protein [Musicola paradisiaca]|uniref:Carrier domain-containing protein n=1 Tax=Musicola paradisiaca (strain Ech703) TaxID=579405 RepID=C6C6L0_MUSP7|nr:acyl carrier protein [Musicola paradisiaca]ACS83929.1 hypothetical protein Dd703_0110 [Musicola paradisiaca Ech703]